MWLRAGRGRERCEAARAPHELVCVALVEGVGQGFMPRGLHGQLPDVPLLGDGVGPLQEPPFA